jgi:hypothetical protein
MFWYQKLSQNLALISDQLKKLHRSFEKKMFLNKSARIMRFSFFLYTVRKDLGPLKIFATSSTD